MVVVVIGLIDHWTGQLALGLFYVLPLATATWLLGKLRGTLVSIVGCIVWLGADATTYSRGTLFWNAFTRFGVFFIIVSLVDGLRKAWINEKALAAKERVVNDDLRRLNDLKDTLLRTVSHDLRNPLAAIIGTAKTLKRVDSVLTGEQRLELVDGIDSSATKLDRLLADLLDLDRIERGDALPDRRPTDLGELTTHLVREATFLTTHPTQVEADPILYAVDAPKVERIIENLLVNAAKYSPSGSPLLVRVGSAAGGVVITVEDEGPGVPDTLKRAIFEPFRQGQKANPGVGVGLSLVSKFAELHEGRAWVEDRDGGGASFKVFLSAGSTHRTAGGMAVTAQATAPSR
jgi:K+-sensing histidine kinase KdpD